MQENEIARVMEEIRQLLVRHRVGFWPEHFEQLEQRWRIANEWPNDDEKRDTLKQIRGIFGGMGSFNDIHINPTAGDDIRPEQVSSVNHELRQLSTRLFELVEVERNKLGGK